MFAPNDYQKIANFIRSKTVEEVEKYSKVFMKRINELQDAARILKNIEQTAKELQYQQKAPSIIRIKVASCQNPEEELKMSNVQKSKYYTPESDIILLIMTDKHQYGEWRKIKNSL